MARGKQISTASTKKPQKAAIVESLLAGSSITASCAAAKIDRKTFYNWQEADKVFALDCALAMKGRISIAKDVAFGNALKSSKDPRYQTSLIAWLNNEGGWNNPQRHEINDISNRPIDKLFGHIASKLPALAKAIAASAAPKGT